MKPIGPLMIEHRLIERMVKLLQKELDRIERKGPVKIALLKAGVDFFRTYADKTHHGKEEDIFFRDLASKNISKEHKNIMEQLIMEHVWARQSVSRLSSATESMGKGNAYAVNEIIHELQKLVTFYPRHIDKEDNYFFKPAMEYFSPSQQQQMLSEFWEFDRNLIHEKYRDIVEQFEKSTVSS